jgi:hypothetical protein
MTKLILASRNFEKAETALSFFDGWLRGLRADLDLVTKETNSYFYRRPKPADMDFTVLFQH